MRILNKTRIKIDLLNTSIKFNTSYNVIILLSLSNDFNIKIDGIEYTLKKDDVIIINQNKNIEINVDSMYIITSIRYKHISELFDNKDIFFVCNSNTRYEDSHYGLKNLVLELFKYKHDNDIFNEVQFTQSIYKFIMYIVHNYGIFMNEDNYDSSQRIISFINKNFDKNINLNFISKYFGMTPQYFSKYFKDNIGLTFLRYLRDVQLENALLDIEIDSSNITSVIMDNGFPNINSFYIQLHNKYNCGLKEYLTNREIVGLNPKLLFNEEKTLKVDKSLSIDALNYKEYKSYWKDIINIENINYLNDNEAQKQFKELQNELNFNYIRLPIFNDLENANNNSLFNFERILDYLLRMNLKIWCVIDVRYIINKSVLEEYINMFSKFLSYFANRYSIDNIKKWKFEIFYNTEFNDEKLQNYNLVYSEIYKILSKYDAVENIIGSGILFTDEENIKKFIEYVNHNKMLFSAYSFNATPLILVKNGDKKLVSTTKDIGYIKNGLNSLLAIFEKYSVDKSIYISKWDEGIIKYNKVNDSCYKGALIVKTIIDSFGKVKALACNNPLDISDDGSLSESYLFGYDGLINKNGIKKPSFFAYKFLNRLGKYFLEKDDNSIIMTNGNNNYQILCHNCAKLNYKYYLNRDDDINSYFDDKDEKKLSYIFNNVKKGRYIVKIRSVNNQFGSVQDNLDKLLGDSNAYLSTSELEYLERISIPNERIEVIEVYDDEVLKIDIKLLPNEFTYIHIIYQY